MFRTMYIGTKNTVSVVASSANAVIGSYWKPSHSETPIPTTNWQTVATDGDRYRGCTVASDRGSRRIRPNEYHVLVAAFDPALALAIVELMIARNTSRNPMPPHAERPRFSHPSPNVISVEALFGPTNTTAAYVQST